MSIATELLALQTHITNAYGAVNDKGGTIPANKNMANLSTAIASISAGGGAKVAYGEVTFDSDQSVASGSGPVITHNLGQVPDFIMVYTQTPSAEYDFLSLNFFRLSSDNNNKTFVVQAGTKSGQYNYLAQTTGANKYFLTMDTTTFQIRGVNSYGKIRSGVKVKWVAGTFA